MEPNIYCADTASIHEDSNYIKMHLFDLTGIKSQKGLIDQLQNQNNHTIKINGKNITVKKLKPVIIGNTSGRDGVLTLNKRTNKFTFLKWQ